MIRWQSDDEYAAEQARDEAESEQARVRRAVAAALRRPPTPRELRRALEAWEG